MTVELSKIPAQDVKRDDTLLFSESAGRFIVTVDPAKKERFEALFAGLPCRCAGKISPVPEFVLTGVSGKEIVRLPINDLKTSWKQRFGDLI